MSDADEDPLWEPIFERYLDPANAKGERLGDPGPPRYCRFCRRTEPEVTFKKDAHVVPAAFGNRGLVTLEECDACNELSSKAEGDLAKFLISEKLSSMTWSRGGDPKHKHKPTSKAYLETDRSHRLINIVTEPDDDSVQLELTAQGFKITGKNQPHYPANVARALARMAYRALDRSQLEGLEHVAQWIKKGDTWERPRFYSLTFADRGILTRTIFRVKRPRPHVRMPLCLEVQLAYSMRLVHLYVPSDFSKVPEVSFPPGQEWEKWEAPHDYQARDVTFSFTHVPVALIESPLSREEIAVAAYRRWLAGGCREGTADHDWLEAEKDLVWQRMGFPMEDRLP